MFKLFLAGLALISAEVYAQHRTLTGLVRDAKTSQPLTGATVQLENQNKFAVTDDAGKFQLEDVAPGHYTLLVKFLGFADQTQGVDFPEQSNVVIELEESARITDEVVVYATRANDKTPATFTNINRQSIQKQNFGQDLPFLLNWTPSVVTTSDAGTGVGYTGIRIRGSDATRVNVTINGIPYNDSESLGTFWVDVPDIASSSQSIQIQRGVGTSTNGAGAFGATINLQTNTRNDLPHAEIINSYGSFNTHRHTLGFGSGLLNNHWVIDGRVSKIQSDGYIDRASSDLSSYYFSTGFYAGNTMIKAIMFGGKERTYQSWYGVPQSRLDNDVEAMLTTAANEGWNEQQTANLLQSNSRTFNPYTYKDQVDDYRQDHYQLHFSQRFSSAFTGNISFHYTPGKGYYEEYRYGDKLANYGLNPIVIGDSTITSSDLVRRRWLNNKFYGFTYAFQYDQDRVNMVLGGGYNRYDGDHYGEIIWSQIAVQPPGYRYYFNNGDKRDFNVYLKTNYQFSERLNGYVDLQYRKISYAVGGIENEQNPVHVDVTYNFFNPKAGVVYAIASNKQWYASYSVANREPVRDDFVNAPSGETPRHETLHNLETGLRLSGKSYALNINYYLMDYKNQLVLTGQLNDVGASLRTNVDKSYRTGVELEGMIKIVSNLTWNANLTVSRNKISSFKEILYDYGSNYDAYTETVRAHKNTDISFSPNIIAGSSLTYRIVKNIELTFLSKYVGRQYLDNTSNKSRSIDPYVVNDLRLTYSIQPTFIKEIRVSLLVNNVLGEKYESNGYTWGYLGGGMEFRENYYFPQARRNFLAMVTLRF
jgi:iron complex outermembrane receptor protein